MKYFFYAQQDHKLIRLV